MAAPTPSNKVIDWASFESTAIVRTTRGKKIFICSAVLVSAKLAITTAHCVDKSDKNEILLGVSLTDPNLRTYLVDTKKMRIHPDYRLKKSFFGADLAVLPLVESASVNRIATIPEPKAFQLSAKQALERVGFGLRNSQNLRTWTEVFVEKVEKHNLYLQDALSVIGDSGSAIFSRQGNELQLVGLHSTLLDPGKVAAVYLPDFKAWIFEGANK